ncbi:MAG: hypothetical protein HYU29_08045 [Chloroflexi bacterium]|nr:hypothetical protein [Chloroflexota bacterium]
MAEATIAAEQGRRPSRGGALFVAVLGLATLAVYTLALTLPFSIVELGDKPLLSLAGLTGRTAKGIFHYLLALGLPFLFYLEGLVACLRWRVPLSLVIGFSLLFGLALMLVYPLTAVDVFVYGAQARVLTHHGANPQVVAPAAFPDDPFLGWMAFKEATPPYGPLWTYLAAIPTLIGGEEPMRVALGMKALSLASLMGSVLLVYAIAQRFRPGTGTAAAYLLGWNPLVLWSTAGDGHNDMVMAFFVLLAFFLLQREPSMALSALILAGLVKYAALLLAPLFLLFLWRRHNLAFMIASVALAVGVGAIVLAPLWEGLATFGGLLGHLGNRASMSLGSIFILAGQKLGLSGNVVALAGRDLLYGAFLGLYIFFLVSFRGTMDGLVRSAFLVTFSFLVLATFWFRFWYLLWLVPLTALLPLEEKRLRTVGLAFSGSAILLYLFTDYVWVWTGLGLVGQMAAVLTVFLPPVLVWLYPRRLPRPFWK